MALMNTVKDIIQLLKSDKIKERHEGIEGIIKVFDNPRAVEAFPYDLATNAYNPRNWLPVFQALFHAVLNEKAACVKKATGKSAASNATAQRRTAEAAHAVRFLLERCCHGLNGRVTKALFEHLTQTMVYKGDIFSPVALDYIKALRCLVDCEAHLDHMDVDLWVRLVEMGFNIILDDPIKASFDADTSSDAVASDVEGADVDMYVDDSDQGKPSTPSQSRKRQRQDSGSTMPKPKRHRQQLAVRPEQMECMLLLASLLRPSSIPILSPDHQHLPSAILSRLARFLDKYPSETSMHHDYLMALSATLSHLHLNKKYEVERFAKSRWDQLVGIWGTKNRRMKESLVVVLRILFPYVVLDPDDIGESNTTAPGCAHSISKLWNLLNGEAESRWGMEGLALNNLRLELVEIDGQAGVNVAEAFVAGTFRAGWGFDVNHALTWAILELQADCAAKVRCPRASNCLWADVFICSYSGFLNPCIRHERELQALTASGRG